MAKLTAAQVKHAKQGPKTWLLRYKHQRRERWMGLGSLEFVTLAEARERAFRAAAQAEARENRSP